MFQLAGNGLDDPGNLDIVSAELVILWNKPIVDLTSVWAKHSKMIEVDGTRERKNEGRCQ